VGEGMFSWVLKVFQYLCSAVKGSGPEGNFNCGKGATSAAILLSLAASRLPYCLNGEASDKKFVNLDPSTFFYWAVGQLGQDSPVFC